MPASVRKLDFTDVKDQGQFNRRRKPSGEYRAKIVAVDDHESKEGNDNFVFTIQVDGDKRASYPYYCGLQVKQLWKLRNLFLSTGLKSPAGKAKIDPNKLVGRTLGIILDDDEYEGRLNSVIGDIFPVSEGGDFLNDGDSSKKKKPVADDDDEEDDEEEDDEPAPVKKKGKKPAPVEEEDDEEEDDEEEEPAPKKKKKPVEDDEDDEPPVKKKKGKKARRRNDEEDDELDTDEL